MALGRIPVERLFNRVNSDLARKDRGGFTNSEEFNRSLIDAQSELTEYYYSKYEIEQKVPDGLIFMLKTVELPIASGIVTPPDDYRHRLGMNYWLIKSGTDCDGASKTRRIMRYVGTAEREMAEVSPVRGASVSKRRFYHYISDQVFYVLPKTLTGTVEFAYLSHPVEAKYGVVINLTTGKEEFDPLTSVDPDFPLQEEQNLVDILLFYKGIMIRENSLISFVMQRRQLQNSIEPSLDQ